MKNSYLYILIVIVIIVLFTSCKYKQSTDSTATEDTLLTKTIVFPNNLLKLEDTQFKEINEFKNQIKNKTKIISIVDGNCMKCIVNQLNKVDSVFSDILQDDNNCLIIVLNVSKHDSAFFMHNLQPSINTTATILWDNNYNFERENQLFTKDIYLRTFMVNDTNKIIHYGNPLFEPELLKEYKQIINK